MSSPDFPHETQVRVRYGEVDRMGYLYHAHYLVYFEQGRTEYLRSLGGTYRGLEEGGTLLVVIETGVRHLRAAEYDDVVTIRTRLAESGKVRMRFEYEMRRGEELLAVGYTAHAATNRAGRPVRLPGAFKALLQSAPSGADGKPDGPTAVQGGAPEGAEEAS